MYRQPMHPFAYGALLGSPKCCVAHTALTRRAAAYGGFYGRPVADKNEQLIDSGPVVGGGGGLTPDGKAALGAASVAMLTGLGVSLAWTGFAVYGIVCFGKKRRWW